MNHNWLKSLNLISGWALRGLGLTRTLVLLDRQRLVPTDANGLIDVSLFPTALLSGVDVVTGGASAAWGSDAVAGVVNFRLDSRYKGIGFQAESGISKYGDGFAYKLGGKFGWSVGDDLHIVGTVEHERNRGVRRIDANDRDFGQAEFALFANPNAPPAQAILPNVYLRETFGGLIVGGPLNNTQILPGGGLAPYVPCGPVVGNNLQCPTPQDLPFTGYFAQLYSPLERTSGFVRASYDVSSDVTLFADVLAGRSRTNFFTVPATSAVLGNLVANRDNAFLPAALAAAMDANGLSSVAVRRFFRDQGPLVATRESGIVRGSLGVNGKLGGGWKADAYVSYGESKLDSIFDNVTVLQPFRNAVDSVRVNGVPTCRINADAVSANDDPACRPLNFFGDGAIATTPESVSYWTGRAFANTRSDQFSAAGNISGEPFSTWAGPVSLAAGVEYRSFKTRIDVDERSLARAFFAINPQPLSGKIDVKEAFGELVVPLAKDLPFADNLELNLAGRITDYSTSGTVTTWKLGANYAPIDGLRFRGTVSRDIRAPNVNELFSRQNQAAALTTAIDRRDNVVVNVRALVGGNPDLDPEIGKTWSGGVVFEPSFLPGFQLSADYYDIKVSGAITSPTVQQVIDACAAGVSGFCDLVYRNDVAGGSTGGLTRVDAVFVNLARLRTRGLDIEGSYRTPLGGGTLALRGLANHTIGYKQRLLTTVLDSTGTQVNPRWAADGSIAYELDDSDLFLGLTYRGPGRINPSFTREALGNNFTDSVVYVNTAIGHVIDQGGHKLGLRFSINNLFDRKPPYGFPSITLGDNYDRVGRFFKVAVRYEM